jgi:hypothetical protein
MPNLEDKEKVLKSARKKHQLYIQRQIYKNFLRSLSTNPECLDYFKNIEC